MAITTSDFTEIAIGEFFSGTELPVDLFIKLSEDKFVQIAKAGDRVQVDRLLNYESKNVTHLLIRNKDYPKYLGTSLSIAAIVIKNAGVPVPKRQSVLIQLSKNVFNELERIGMRPESLTYARAITESTVALCQSNPDLSSLVEHFALEQPSLYAHSVAVAAVSVMIGKELHWKSVTLEKLGLGGLLHDIGMLAFPPDLSTKQRAEMNEKDRADYQSHVVVGMNMLRAVPQMPDDVVAIAHEHHETADGKGFPRKIRSIYINPLARIVSLANVFAGLTTKHHEGVVPMPAAVASGEIQRTEYKYWPDAVDALKKIIK